MLRVYVWLTEQLRREEGQDMIEYALIASVSAIAVVLATAAILQPAFATWADGVGKCVGKLGVGTCKQLLP